MDEYRVLVALFGVAVAAVVGFIAYRFIAAITVAIFVYYSTRRFYKGLRKFHLSPRMSAVVTSLFLAAPLVVLIGYTAVLLVIETQQFIETYPVLDMAQSIGGFNGIDQVPELTIQGIIDAYQAGELDAFISFATNNAAYVTSTVSNFFLNLFIVVVLVYYLLVDGDKLRRWLLRFDEDALVREYFEAADKELEAVLFGNLLNVIAVSLIAVVTFMAYNAYVPAAVEVPYPTVAGALTGVASLVPVVGMKIVYLPLTGIAALSSYLQGELSLLVYVAGFLVLTIVVVDTIPDIVLRPFLSGERTHVGLLMLAYIFGPVVLGFYGLFFAPIMLVLGHTYADTTLPRLLGAEPEPGLPKEQASLDDFW